MREKAMDYRRALFLAAASLMLVVGADRFASRAADPTSSASLEPSFHGITKPSKDPILSFQHQGRVAEMLVHPGDVVKAGQPVARLDDTVEQWQLAQDQKAATDETEEQAEAANEKKDEVDLQKLHESGAGSASEIRDAELKIEIDKARIKLAKEKRETAGLKMSGTTADLERMKIYSPIDGVVAQAMLQVGESAESGNMRALKIVELDPLWVEAPVAVLQARKLKNGDSAAVEFTDKSIRKGKVIWVSPTGDSASSTILVRIEVPNPEKISSGENVSITFPGNVPVAKQ